MLRREVYPWLKDKNLLSKVCPIDTPTLVEMNMASHFKRGCDFTFSWLILLTSTTPFPQGKKPFYVLDIEEVHKDGQKAYILVRQKAHFFN